MGDAVFNMFNSVFGGEMFSGVEEILKLNPSVGKYTSLWKVVTDTYDNVVVPIAAGLLFIYFLVFVIQRSADERFNWDQLFMLCAKMIIGKYLIDNGMDILTQLWGLGISLVTDLGELNGKNFGKSVLEQPWKDLTGCSWDDRPGMIASIGAFATMLLPWACAWVIKLIVQIICYARLLELLVKTVLSPLAFADFFTEGLHGAGWRFLKGYFATCLQGFTIAVTLLLFSHLSGSILNNSNWATFSGTYVVIGFSAVAAVVKSQQIIREVFGV